jgi:hypothetical protein
MPETTNKAVADNESIVPRLSLASDDNLRLILDISREMMLTSTRDIWRIQARAAAAEIRLRSSISNRR